MTAAVGLEVGGKQKPAIRQLGARDEGFGVEQLSPRTLNFMLGGLVLKADRDMLANVHESNGILAVDHLEASCTISGGGVVHTSRLLNLGKPAELTEKDNLLAKGSRGVVVGAAAGGNRGSRVRSQDGRCMRGRCREHQG
jgi:hypothetical protein